MTIDYAGMEQLALDLIKDPIERLAVQGAARLKKIQDEQAAEAQARADAAQAERDQLWAPIVATIKAQLPAEFQSSLLHWPAEQKPAEYALNGAGWRYLAVRLGLPGCAPIGCYVQSGTVFYKVCQPSLENNEFSDGWIVNYGGFSRARDQYDQGAYTDLAIAVYMAKQYGGRLAELQAEAERRNAQAQAEPEAPSDTDPAPPNGSRPDPGYVLAQALHDFMAWQGFQY